VFSRYIEKAPVSDAIQELLPTTDDVINSCSETFFIPPKMGAGTKATLAGLSSNSFLSNPDYCLAALSSRCFAIRLA